MFFTPTRDTEEWTAWGDAVGAVTGSAPPPKKPSLVVLKRAEGENVFGWPDGDLKIWLIFEGEVTGQCTTGFATTERAIPDNVTLHVYHITSCT